MELTSICILVRESGSLEGEREGEGGKKADGGLMRDCVFAGNICEATVRFLRAVM